MLEIRIIMAAASKSKAEKEREKVQQDRCQVSPSFLKILLFSLQETFKTFLRNVSVCIYSELDIFKV